MDDTAEGGNDEIISQFMAVTSCADADKAASYLEMSGYNVETAVGLYMEHETGGGGYAATSGGAGAAAAADPGMMMMPDDIRAPDATRTMRLMEDNMGNAGMMMGMMPPGMDAGFHLMNAMMDEEIAQSSAFGAQVTADGARARLEAVIAAQGAAAVRRSNSMLESEGDENEEGKVDTDEDDDYEVVARLPDQPANLTDMFSPPVHLMHRAGGFQGARTMAKDSKRWLLVNIQRDSEFSSHALNRDVWRDELVENLVREGFIFWQQMDSMPEGRTYTERYQVHSFPHIGIVDPRTGRLLWRKEGWTQENPVTAASFAEHAMDFCSRNSFDRPPQAPRPAAPSASARPAKRSMNEMSESEQLEAAMRASMEDVAAAVDDEVDAGVHYTDEDDDDDEVEVLEVKPSPVEEKPPSLMDELMTVTVPAEPADGSRIQLRMPDGKRAVRKFTPSDPVRTIYAHLAQTLEEARGGREFSLMAGFPPKDLINDIDNTIEASGLEGGAITVRWK